MSEITPEPISTRQLAQHGHRFADVMLWRVVHNWQEENKAVIPHTPGEPFQVVLTINGVQMPFIEAVEDLQKCLHEIAEKHADKILQEKTRDLDRKLSRIGWRIENLLRLELKEFADHEREEPYELEGFAPPQQETPTTEPTNTPPTQE